MLINTLKMLVLAGKDALRTTCGLPVISEDITQIRTGQLTFPAMGEIAFSGGTLQTVSLGCDGVLCGHLAEKVVSKGEDSGFEILANRFLDNVLEEMAGRHPRGWLANLEVGPQSLQSRGVRSFGVRLQTDIGQFFLMAEIPSRAELEQSKSSEFITSMSKTYLPEGWATFQELKYPTEIDNFLIFLRKTELDLLLEVPCGDGYFTIHTGVLLETTTIGGRQAMRLSMDVSGPEGKSLEKGETVNLRVGVQDRALTFKTQYLGSENYPITSSASIKCVFFSLPKVLQVLQGRRAFRIQISERIPTEIECINPLTNDSPLFSGDTPGRKVRGRLADLSFSGARIIAQKDKLVDCANLESRIVCRLFFPNEPTPLKILGIVRRSTISLADRDNQQDEIGIEFLVNDDSDRQAIEFIQQYVLSQQRAWLAQRIHVTSPEQWPNCS